GRIRSTRRTGPGSTGRMVGAGMWGIMGAECSRLRKQPRPRREGSDERVVSARHVAARSYRATQGHPHEVWVRLFSQPAPTFGKEDAGWPPGAAPVTAVIPARSPAIPAGARAR